jgi:hypothetical protein
MEIFKRPLSSLVSQGFIVNRLDFIQNFSAAMAISLPKSVTYNFLPITSVNEIQIDPENSLTV